MIYLEFNKHFRGWTVLLGISFLFCSSGISSATMNQYDAGYGATGGAETLPVSDRAVILENYPVYLYFSDENNDYLIGEERRRLKADDPVALSRLIVEAIIQGPAGEAVETIPKDTKVRAVFIDDKIAYIDLSQEVSGEHPGGIAAELMTVYSIVNTLILNIDEVDQVKILIEGDEKETLAGHIDIRFPLNADILLIR